MVTRSFKKIFPAVLGLALSSSFLAGPSTATAAPSLLPGVTTPISTWQQRLSANYNAYRRHCSAPKAENSIIDGQSIILMVKKQTDKNEIARAKAARCSKSLIKKGRVYSNAMVSTEYQPDGMVMAGVTTPTVVEARIKFPRAKGMHGGVWIQSAGGAEIDMIESYGTRVTHVYHLKNAKQQLGLKSITKSATWYQSAHVFKVAFTTKAITYYIDGKVTKKVTKAKLPANTHYFIVASLLSSDWEVAKINNATLANSKMIVEWVRITQGS